MDLHEAARHFGTDKGPRVTTPEGWPHGHGYTLVYEREFARFGVGRLADHLLQLAMDEDALLGRRPSILELGIFKGASLRLWDSYFPEYWKIVGADIMIPPAIRADLDMGFEHRERVHLAVGDSTRLGFAKDIEHEHGKFEIIIDDASHIPAHQVATLQNFWPLLKTGGIYCIEDLHQSWWPALYKMNSIMPVLQGLSESCIGRGKFAEWSGVPAEDPVVKPEEEVLFRLAYYRNMVVLEKRVKS